MGTIAGIQGDAVAAARSFDRVLQHGDYDSILLRRGLLLPAIYDSVEQIDECRQAFEENLDRLIESGLEIANPFRDSAISVFYLAYHGRNDKD